MGRLLSLPSNEIDISWEDPEEKRTAFYKACYYGHTAIAQLFLADARTLVSHQQGQGATPLYIFCFDGRIEFVKLLLADLRVDVNLRREDETTSFFVACQEGHLEVVKLLLDDGRADLNQQRRDTISPAWIASQNGHLGIVKELIASWEPVRGLTEPCGAGVFVWNSRTAAQQARSSGFQQLAVLLEEYAGKREETAMRIRKELGKFSKSQSTVVCTLHKFQKGGSCQESSRTIAQNPPALSFSLTLPFVVWLI